MPSEQLRKIEIVDHQRVHLNVFLLRHSELHWQ